MFATGLQKKTNVCSRISVRNAELKSIWKLIFQPWFFAIFCFASTECDTLLCNYLMALPDCPDACETLPAGLPERSISTMAAVHSVIMGEPVRWFEIILEKCGRFSTSSPLLRPSFRILCPDLLPRLWFGRMVSSPDDRSSSSDNVSLPRLFLDLK